MRDAFANYDNWLERPYQEMTEESDHFYEWAEEQDYDLDDPDQASKAQWEYESYIAYAAEDAAEAQYERYLDRLEDEAQEREWE